MNKNILTTDFPKSMLLVKASIIAAKLGGYLALDRNTFKVVIIQEKEMVVT